MGCMSASAVSLLLVCVIASLVGSAHAQCTTELYVSKVNGNDTNIGTPAAPFFTISAAWTNGNLCSNGTIWVASGAYTEATSIFSTPANIIATGDVSVMLVSGLRTSTAAWNSMTMLVAQVNASTVTFQNCTFTTSLVLGTSTVIIRDSKFTANVITVDTNITIVRTSFVGINTTTALFVTRGILNAIQTNFTQNTLVTTGNCFTTPAQICGGSAIKVLSPQSVVIKSSTFESNSVRFSGGLSVTTGGAVLVYDPNNATTLIENSTFNNNTQVTVSGVPLYVGEAIFALVTGSVTLRNCTFTNVKQPSLDGPVSLYGPATALTSSATIIDQTFANLSGCIGVQTASVSIVNSVFSNISTQAIRSPVNTLTITVVNTTFGNLTGPAMQSSKVQTLLINGSTFSNIAAAGGKIITLDTIRTGSILNSKFENINTSGVVALFLPDTLTNYSMSIINCNFSSLISSSQILYFGGKQATVLISNSTFMNNVAVAGGVTVNLQDQTNATVQNCYFGGNHGGIYGGALSMRATTYLVSNSIFRNNVATYGGAIGMASGINSVMGTISGCTFEDNSANNMGGALFLPTAFCVIDNSTFARNSAQTGAGAIYYVIRSATSFNITDSVFIRNEDYSVLQGGGAILITMAAGSLTDINILGSAFIDNVANNFGGAVFVTSDVTTNTTISIETTLFTNNSATNGGAVYLSPFTVGTIESSHFTNNHASSGGSISFNNAYAMLSNTLIENSQAAYDGGAIMILSSAQETGSLVNCTFNSNTAIIGNGGAIYFNTQGSTAISASTFINNSAPSANGGAIYLTMSAAPTFSNCHFSDNLAYQGGALLADLYSVPSFHSTVFESNTGSTNGGAMLCQSESQPVFSNCVFTSNNGQNGGALAVMGQSQPIVQQCVFKQNGVEENGGAIYVTTRIPGFPIVTDTEFKQNTGVNGGGLSCGGVSMVPCTNCSFIENSVSGDGGAAYMEGSCSLVLKKSSFRLNSAVSGGGVYCGESNTLTLENCATYANTAVTGGAVQWGRAMSSTGITGTVPVSSTTGTGSVNITATDFNSNTASIGGAVDMNLVSFSIRESTFNSNKATYGAGLYFVSKLTGELRSNVFSDNNASVAGGGYFWDTNSLELPPNCVACTFSENTADYGDDHATGPTSVSVIATGNATVVTNSRVGPIYLTVLDGFQSIVSSSILPLYAQVSLNETKGQLYGTTVFYSSRGIVEIPSVGINGYFGHNYTLGFTMAGIVGTTFLPIIYRGCEVGQEGYADNDQFNFTSCRDCAAGYYNLNGDNTCYLCPENAQCNGDTRVTANTNYWLLVSDAGFASTYDCPAGFCDNGGRCAEHRSGILCGKCEEGFQNSDGACIECTETDPGSLFSNLLMLWVFIIILQLVSRAPEGKSTDSVVSGLTKIVVFFVQTIPFVMTPAYQIRKLFSFFNFQLFFNVASKCSFKADFYQNFLIYNFLPAILFGFLILNLLIHIVVHFVARCLNHRWERHLKVDKTWYIRTLTSLLSFSYTTITQNVVLYLNCRDVGDSRVVASSPDISCRTDKYAHYSALAYILLALYVLAFPIALAGFLYWAKMKKWFDNEKFSLYAGLIYQPFRSQYYFWEVVILVRRLIVIGIYVLAYSTTSARNLGLFCFALLMLSLHVVTKPFASKTENNVETALLVLLTLLAGTGASYADEQFKDDISVFTSVITFMAVIPVGVAVYQLALALLIRYHLIKPSATSSGSVSFLSSSRQDLLPRDTPPTSETTTRSSSPNGTKHIIDPYVTVVTSMASDSESAPQDRA